MSMIELGMIGNLGNDAEIRTINGGREVINFSVAHSERYTNKEGLKVEKTTWVACSIFRDKGNTGVAEYLKKGQAVFVCGEPKIDLWNDKETGEAKGRLALNVRMIQIIGSKSENNKEE